MALWRSKIKAQRGGLALDTILLMHNCWFFKNLCYCTPNNGMEM